MIFTSYDSPQSFGRDTLQVLLKDEVQNNLPISFILNESNQDTSDWILATVKDNSGQVVLTAACTPPFRMVMYETANIANDDAVQLLADELKERNMVLSGVVAETTLARRFAEAFAGIGKYRRHLSMNIMRLDKVNPIAKAQGNIRLLQQSDLYFEPYWERAFQEECKVEVFDLQTNYQRAFDRLQADDHFIWQDEHPVAQAYHARSTQNGAGVSGVYTPPQYRGRGYASSLVAEMSEIFLSRGYQFCFLFADAENPISCSIYRKIGYYDLCVFEEIDF